LRFCEVQCLASDPDRGAWLFDGGGTHLELREKALAMAFETAMVDAINRYVREVLHSRGLISLEAMEEHASKECLEAKYAIAQEWGVKWATFVESSRHLPGETSQTEQVAQSVSRPPS
jgi:hypothetical protein